MKHRGWTREQRAEFARMREMGPGCRVQGCYSSHHCGPGGHIDRHGSPLVDNDNGSDNE